MANHRRSKSAEEALREVQEFIEANGGIVKKEQLGELEIDYRRILEFVEEGKLVRIKNGYYTDRMDRFTEEELIARLNACSEKDRDTALQLLEVYLRSLDTPQKQA